VPECADHRPQRRYRTLDRERREHRLKAPGAQRGVGRAQLRQQVGRAGPVVLVGRTEQRRDRLEHVPRVTRCQCLLVSALAIFGSQGRGEQLVDGALSQRRRVTAHAHDIIVEQRPRSRKRLFQAHGWCAPTLNRPRAAPNLICVDFD
jgi:hypothetical protein